MLTILRPPISVLCVDDNEDVANAVRVKLSHVGGFEWMGWLEDATALLETARTKCPKVVLVDLDMPGPDPFDVVRELSKLCPEVRPIVFTGHVRKNLIDRAIEVGAWGYVAKNDGDDALVSAIRRVAAGEFVLSPQVRAAVNH